MAFERRRATAAEHGIAERLRDDGTTNRDHRHLRRPRVFGEPAHARGRVAHGFGINAGRGGTAYRGRRHDGGGSRNSDWHTGWSSARTSRGESTVWHHSS